MDKPFPAYRGDEPYIFVSYAHADDEIVYPEIQWLHDQGFNIWYDEGIAPGSTWRDEVALALAESRGFLFFVSPAAVASRNCQQELNFCFTRDKKVLCVVLAETQMPPGIELSLSDKQLIIRSEYQADQYAAKLLDALRELLLAPEQSAAPGEAAPSDERNSIAVMPLANRSSDPENEYLSDGITEELINGLSKIDGLRVTSRDSVFARKDMHLDVKAAGAAFGVASILSGSLQKSDNRVRVTVQLSNVGDGSTMWSERYDRELDDLFELQDELARRVIDALQVEIAPSKTEKLIDVGTADVGAYDSYLLGMHELRKFTRQSVTRAIDHLREATRRDPQYLTAHGFLVYCYSSMHNRFGQPLDEIEETVMRELEIIHALDPDNFLVALALDLPASTARSRFRHPAPPVAVGRKEIEESPAKQRGNNT